MELFKKQKEDQAIKEPALRFFHEDYLKVELSSFENKYLIERETEKVLEFNRKHSVKDRLRKIYLGKAQLNNLFENRITLQMVEEITFNSGFNKIKKVYRFSMSWEEVFYNTIGFELEGSKIFVEYREDLVKHIWIEGFRLTRDKILSEKMLGYLLKLGNKWNLILIDWNIEKIIDLKSMNDVINYLNGEE